MHTEMTKQRLDMIATVGLLVALGASFWRPEATWPTGLALLSVIVAVVGTDRLTRQADQRSRHTGAWLAPALLLAMAVQLVLGASDAERTRAFVLGACLVVASIGWYWVHRRASR